MATAPQRLAVETPTTLRAPRVASVDIFRGLTMIVMIFVNDLAEVKGLPWWTYHAPGKVDAMTYVDMVFPAFLFILGMAIPLATEQRLRKNPSHPHLWLHVSLRSLSLLVLGLILANAGAGDPALIHMPKYIWAILALTGAILYWMVYPKDDGRRTLYNVLRYSGLALMIVMFAVFRRTTKEGNVAWIKTAYPEILGLLAFAYLTTCILYIPTRRWRWAPFAWFVVLTAFCYFCAAHRIEFPRRAGLYLWPFGNGSDTLISMAGVATSVLFVGEQSKRWPTFRAKATYALAFATIVLSAGYLLTPLGISKIRATPTWSLYCVGSSILIFTLLYYICDTRQKTRWAAFTHAPGSNTLLTYLLPDLWSFILGALGITWFRTHLAWGFPGIIHSIVFTAIIVAIAASLTRMKLRLQL
jgi:heparan-alpha-glucosaminide N-acetyltransferase